MRIRFKRTFAGAVLVSVLLAACTSAGRDPGDTSSGASGSGAPGSGKAWLPPAATELPAPTPVVEVPPAPPVAETPQPVPGPQEVASAPREARTIFYNATLAPQLPRNAAAPTMPVLQVGVKATLSFDIGAKDEAADVSSVAPPEIAGATEDLPLAIIFGCDFCPPRAEFARDIVYKQKEGRSDRVVFEFTPDPRRDGRNYAEQLHLLILNRKTGRPIDRINIPVSVTSRVSPAVAVEAVEALSFPRKSEPQGESAGIDLTIHAIAAEGPAVTFSFEPHSAAMIRLLGNLALDEKGNRRKFRSGVNDPALIDEEAAWSFAAMSAASLQDKGLAKLRATGNDATMSVKARKTLVFSDGEASNVADLMAATGQHLYASFFHRGDDDDLGALIALLEQAGSDSPRRLRVQITTDRLAMPWQYLHPVGNEVDPNKFWGMKFSLSVLRLNDGGENWRESTPVPDSEPKPRKILFAHYGTSTDPSVPLAREQIKALKAALPKTPRMDVLPVYAGKDLVNRLKTDKDAITGFITFMHASSGDQRAAPLLQFGLTDKVEGADFIRLRGRQEVKKQKMRYLSMAPLAVLNACETGPALRLTQLKLGSSLFQLGVKGVIVTEVSVWQTLGDEMGKRLMTHLVKGETAADALTAVRRELLLEKNNPLGLLYAFYGDPAAKLISSSSEVP